MNEMDLIINAANEYDNTEIAEDEKYPNIKSNCLA